MARTKPHVSLPADLFFEEDGFRWCNTEKLAPSIATDAALSRFCKTLPSPQRYLKQVAPQFGWARLLLQHGKRMAVSPFHPTCEKLPAGKCFSNAYWLRQQAVEAQQQNLWYYTEGIGLTPGGAKRHAWSNVGGEVIELTWHYPHSVKYFGFTLGDDLLTWLNFATGLPFGVLLRSSETATYIDNYCRHHGKGGLRV